MDVFRRNLQRAYLEAVDAQLNPPPPRPPAAAAAAACGGSTHAARDDARALLRGELAELRTLAERAPRAAPTTAMTRLHLRDVRMEIDRILDPSRD